MPNAETFWQYADAAMQCARTSTIPEERRALTDLALMWSQVALHSEDAEEQLDGPGIKSH